MKWITMCDGDASIQENRSSSGSLFEGVTLESAPELGA